MSDQVEPASDGRGVLRVHRSGRHYRDHLRSYQVLVDGEPMGSVAAASSIDVPLAAGRHTLRATIDWTGSPELAVQIESGATIVVRVEPAGSTFTGLFQMFTSDGYLRLVRE